jgi:hypothetical protein
MRRNNAWSGHAAAKATRTRVAVSVMRAAILRRRVRRVVNSALASGCGLSMVSRTVSISQWAANAAVTFLRPTAGNQSGSVVSLCMAGVARCDRVNGMVSTPNP